VRRLLAILVLALVGGVLSFAWVRGHRAGLAEELVKQEGSDIAWLRMEFALTDEQFAANQKLHEDYRPQCASHCAAIIGATAEVRKLEQSTPGSAELTAAQQAVADLESVCNTATREHLYKVAALMSPDDGPRFLRMTEPQLSDPPHDGIRGPVR
jgi:hypothetical protein